MRTSLTLSQRAYQQTKRIPLLRSLVLFVMNWVGLIAARAQQTAQYPEPSNPILVTDVDAPFPTIAEPVSQLCTAAQCREPAYRHWVREIRSPMRYNRKQWEFVFILQSLQRRGMLAPGRRGLGFGCGREPLPAVAAKHDVDIVATDLELKEAARKGWVDGRQHASRVDQLNFSGICPADLFRKHVRFEVVDMNAVPERYYDSFDFTWSACSLEHLGSLRHGIEFVLASLRCLKPGGVAVHTTEFNLSSNEDTLEDPNCVVYRRRDIEASRDELAGLGYELAPLNFNAGSEPIDRYVDVPPYLKSPSLRIELDRYSITSIGLIIGKPLGFQTSGAEFHRSLKDGH